MYGVAAVGVTLSLWLLPTFGGLRFGLTMAIATLIAGAVWR
jgi:hypothetical protein